MTEWTVADWPTVSARRQLQVVYMTTPRKKTESPYPDFCLMLRGACLMVARNDAFHQILEGTLTRGRDFERHLDEMRVIGRGEVRRNSHTPISA